MTWVKSGTPIRTVGPVPDRKASVQARASLATEWPGAPDYMRPLLSLWNVRVDHEAVLRSGSRVPIFDARPAGFVQRRGQLPTHNFFSGTFTADGVRLGYIRTRFIIPLPISNDPFTTAIVEFAGEVAFMQQNTDGLIVDVMRNPGGLVFYVDTLCSLLSPVPFRTIGLEVRATQNWVLQFDSSLQSARAQNAPEWVINLLTSLLDALRKANAEQRGMTGPLPFSALTLDLDPLPGAYTKPIIVGSRTNGAGRNVVNVAVGAYT
ncbi:MAG: hypothetical protein FJW31_02005 [Acidobacteria bacterium]|nr:hypothetical protein [Acidobacteriota bacterium]